MLTINIIVFSLLFQLLEICSVHSQEAGCAINLNKDLPKENQPIILKKMQKNYTLLIPKVKNQQGFIELDKGEEVILACPGKGNYLKEVKQDKVKTNCISDTKFSVNNSNTIFNTKNAECAESSRADVKNTGTRCAQVGTIFEIGFEAEGWHLMVSVCHDTSQSNTLYTKHTLIGSALQGAERESNRPKFSDGELDELYYGFNPDTCYKKKAQETMFKNVVGDKKISDYFQENGTKFLSRGHLAPDADFLFGSWQFATYFYINAAPQWQSINGKNWLTVEKLVRSLGIKSQTDLSVITGTFGTVELEDEKGKLQKIYLNNQKRSIPVPMYYWKVVCNPKTKNGIGLVTSNNPYLKTGTKISFCKDICSSNGWANNNMAKEFQDITKGLTVCCSVSELRKVIPHIPFVDVEGVLKGPQ